MRTEGDLIKINDWLLPLSWIYGGMVRFRNWLFDIGLKKSQSFSIPIISVGNITVGGSGKTPHVEYLIRLLHDKVKIAVLSRGYKRPVAMCWQIKIRQCQRLAMNPSRCTASLTISM